MISIGIADKVTLDAVDTNVNNANARIGTVDTNVNTANARIGTDADSASATGSLHAKAAYIAGKNIVKNGSAIKSIQRSSIELNNEKISATATISSVNTSKAMLNFLGARSSNYTVGGYTVTGHHFITLELTNSTTITAYRRNNGTSLIAGYEVIEFY